MAKFRPKELQEYLAKIGAKPSKSLSQNFLIDGNILNKIVDLAEVTKDDLVVEVGPGPGALTERLLETGCDVVAIEKDATFAKALSAPKLCVIEADALEYDLQPHIAKKAKVVANLPYNVTTPLLQRFLKQGELFSSLIVMVQDEVARRLTMPCPPKDFVAFTLFLQYYSKPRYGFIVSPTCFYPAPGVYSAVIRLDLEKRFPVQDEDLFFTLVNAAFSQRRKMIKATLKPWYEPQKLIEALEFLKKAPTSRPEDLSTEEWVKLYNKVKAL